MLIQAERQRQIDTEGWTAAHDDGHRYGALAIQAAALAVNHTDARVTVDGEESDPWSLLCKAKNKGTVRNLTIAGALIAAEIDRLQRLEVSQ